MKIGVCGISGKMGRVIADLVENDDVAILAAGYVRKGNEFDGKDVGEFLKKDKNNRKITSDIDEFFASVDGVIDFSSAELSMICAKKAAEHGKVLVCGTTGFSDEQKKQFVEYGKKTVIIWSSNMSVGVNLINILVEKAAEVLREDYDIEIVEIHHKFKADSPSGTALTLGNSAAKGRGKELEELAVMSRVGTNLNRKKGEIGFATLRGGDVVGDHKVVFAGDGERVEIGHKASRRDVFASGAVRAAIWGSNKESGFYSMKDVLGF